MPAPEASQAAFGTRGSVAKPARAVIACGAMSVPTQIGPFKVKGLLGKGAMGEVYEGIDEKLGRRVAIKILGRKHRESEEFKTRFLREGRALAGGER